jgi:hypothetical protein
VEITTEVKLNLPSSLLDMNNVAVLLKSSNEAVIGLGGACTVEVGGAQFVPLGFISQHVPGGGHGDDSLLGTTTGTDAVELCLQVAALDLHGPKQSSFA